LLHHQQSIVADTVLLRVLVDLINVHASKSSQATLLPALAACFSVANFTTPHFLPKRDGTLEALTLLLSFND